MIPLHLSSYWPYGPKLSNIRIRWAMGSKLHSNPFPCPFGHANSFSDLQSIVRKKALIEQEAGNLDWMHLEFFALSRRSLGQWWTLRLSFLSITIQSDERGCALPIAFKGKEHFYEVLVKCRFLGHTMSRWPWDACLNFLSFAVCFSLLPSAAILIPRSPLNPKGRYDVRSLPGPF